MMTARPNNDSNVDVKAMLSDPMTANKHNDNMFAAKPKLTSEMYTMMTIGSGNLLGEEDCEESEPGVYNCHVKCISRTGKLFALTREDF